MRLLVLGICFAAIFSTTLARAENVVLFGVRGTAKVDSAKMQHRIGGTWSEVYDIPELHQIPATGWRGSTELALGTEVRTCHVLEIAGKLTSCSEWSASNFVRLPEPSAALQLLSGLVGLEILRRRL
jgi:hypothetical protein